MSNRSRPEVGVLLEDAGPLIELVKRLQIEDYEVLDPDQVRPAPDRVTVYRCNHGPVSAPLPGFSQLNAEDEAARAWQ